MALPPLDKGGVKATVACALPAVALPIVGAPGTPPVMPKLCVTCAAGRNVALPPWLALIVQVPVVTMVTLLPETVHTLNVVELNVTVSPELAVAVNGTVAGPKG